VLNQHLLNAWVFVRLSDTIDALLRKEGGREGVLDDRQKTLVDGSDDRGFLFSVLVCNQVDELLDLDLLDLLTEDLGEQFYRSYGFKVHQHVLVFEHVHADVENHGVVLALGRNISPRRQLLQLCVEDLHNLLLRINFSHMLHFSKVLGQEGHEVDCFVLQIGHRLFFDVLLN